MPCAVVATATQLPLPAAAMAALAVVTLPADDPSVNLEAGCLLIDRETERQRDRETE